MKFSTAFHPQTDGQSERTIQTLEDMLRACVLDFNKSWNKRLALVEFSYNNSFQASIGMAPYEALYGRKCQSPIHWYETGQKYLEKTDMIRDTTEAVRLIKQRLETAHSRQKSYADSKRRDVSYEVGESVLLKVSPLKGVVRFGKRGKLNPRFIGPFPVIEKVGNVAYRLDLGDELRQVHNVFHVSMLRKYHPDKSHVLTEGPVELYEDLSYVEKPVQILDRKEKVLRNKVIPLVKVLWRNQKIEEATWEPEDSMKSRYPERFT